MEPARKRATYEDLIALAGDVKAEVLSGSLVALPSPLPRHAKVQRALGSFVGGPFDDDDGRGGAGGWWILLEVDVRLSTHDIVRPDLAGWRRERLPAPWDLRPIETRPDWVCEVLSPSNVAHDRVQKRHLYAAHGVPFYWIVDPEARTGGLGIERRARLVHEEDLRLGRQEARDAELLRPSRDRVLAGAPRRSFTSSHRRTFSSADCTIACRGPALQLAAYELALAAGGASCRGPAGARRETRRSQRRCAGRESGPGPSS